MSQQLSDFEKRVIFSLQRDLDITARPFQELAQQVGVSEEEFLAAVRSLVAKGYIRRFGATLRHQLSGYAANALVTWVVPPGDLQRVGKLLSRHQAVTHCYHREPAPGWPYTSIACSMAKARMTSSCWQPTWRRRSVSGSMKSSFPTWN